LKLRDKTAIITGAGGGIGRAAALLFAREDARIGVVDTNEKAARETASLISEGGGSACALTADVLSGDDVKRMVAETAAKLGPATILFNNAGMSSGFPKPSLIGSKRSSCPIA
jgi:NAD(P)-dependent dehydrogenase (short-subunit alcohol dehydrogenase family)